MRKWLVGLLAAGLCATSAWAATDTLDREFTGVEAKATYVEWSGKTGESGAVYAGQSAGDKDSIQLRSNNNNSGIVTTGSGGTATKVTVVWNENTAADREVSVYGKADAYSAATDLYSKDAQGTLIGSIKKGESTELSLGDGYEFIGLRSKSGALYLDSVAIEWDGGSAEFSVTFDKENWFEVEQGTASSVTAIAKHGVEPYTYEWSCDKSELLTGSEATLAIPDTLEADDYSLFCLVKDAELNAINAGIGLRVVAPKAKFAVECAVGIPNGSVSADKTEATEGETVTLTATPAAGYKLDTFLVDGEAITGNTFPMPAHEVLVSASFVEKPVVAGFTKITSLSELTEGEYVITGAKAEGEEYAMKAEVSTTSTAYILRRDEAVTIEEDTVTDAEDSIIWTLEQGENGWTIYNEAVGYAGYVKSGNSAGAEAEPSAKSSWTITESETAGLFLLNNVDKEGRYLLYNASSPRFACYTNINSGKHLALYKGSSGPAVFSVTFDKKDGFEVPFGTADSITATAKNGSGDYSYAWSGDLTGEGATLEIPATLASGPYTVTVTATDNGADAQTVEKSISFTVAAPVVKYQVQVAIGIPNGSVSADKTEAEEGEVVTLTATPDAGYKLEHFLVNDIAISANTFPMPAEDVLVSASFVEKPVVAGFTKITSLSELTEGEYVITGAKAEGEEYAMKAEVSTTSTAYILRRDEAVTIEEDTVTDAEDSIIWTLEQGENGWTIYNEAVGYAGYVKSGNSAGAEAEPTAKSSWTITESETAGLFLLNNVDKEGRYLLYNASSPRFACYTNINSGKHLALYKGSSGPAVFSVTLDPAKDFEVEQNAEAFVTAIPKHAAEGVVGYAWWIDGTPVDTAGEVLALATAELGPHKVICEATDAAGAKADAHVIYTVVAPAVKYAVNVAIGILNGTVTTDVSEAAEGDPVTVTAIPADGYRLVEIIVNNGDVAVSGNTFVMPAQDVLVTATFEEFEVPPYYFQFETGKPAANSYKDTDADVVNTGSTSDTVPTVNFTLQRAGRGGDEKDKFVGTYALRMGPTNEVPAFFYNTEAFSEDITAISFQYGIYGTDKCESFTVSTSADGADWTQLADLTADASADGLKTYTNDELPAGVRFIRFDATSTQKSNIRRINIDEIQLWTGAPSPKIVYSGETTIALGGTFEIIFGLLNYDGDFTWEMGSREGGTIAQEGRDGLYTWTPTSAGDVTITVVARNGELDIASKEVVLTVTEPGPQPGQPALVFGGDTEGTIGTPVNFTVMSVNIVTDPTVYPDGFAAPEGSTLTDDNIDYGEEAESRNVSFTPDVPGDYVFTFTAGAEGAADEVHESVTITVTGSGPVGEKTQITSMKIDGGVITLGFNQNATAIYGTDEVKTAPAEWPSVSGVTFGGKSAAIPLENAPKFMRAE